jgi:protein phosphatase
MKLTCAGSSDRGLLRSNNEDVFLCDEPMGLYLVSDGMGGAAAGEIAAEMVRTGIQEQIMLHVPRIADIGALQRALQLAIAQVNAAILHRAGEDPSLFGMGATLVMVLAREAHALVAHVGDSRCYLHHKGVLRCLTKDHSWVQQLIDSGTLTPEDAALHPKRAALTQCMGMAGPLEPGVQVLKLEAGMQLLLCSDGLYTMLKAEQIQSALQAQSPELAARGLIAGANHAGGEDNITVVVLQVQ